MARRRLAARPGRLLGMALRVRASAFALELDGPSHFSHRTLDPLATPSCQCAMGCYTARLVLANCSCPLREGRYIEGPCTEGRWHLPRGLGCSLTRRPSFPKKKLGFGVSEKTKHKKARSRGRLFHGRALATVNFEGGTLSGGP